MRDQLDLFGNIASPASFAPLGSPLPTFPAGFKFQPDLITPEAERTLLEHIRTLPFKEFEFHGYVGKRRTVSFGAHYDFASESLQSAESIPPVLLELRAVAAAFAKLPSDALQQVLVTEYGEGAGIGWHRDKSIFGEVVGISLLSPCKFRLRRKAGAKWERITIDATPRSAYHLSGPARTEWEHSIPAVAHPRYSITFRSLRSGKH